jgi:hypothetical protein
MSSRHWHEMLKMPSQVPDRIVLHEKTLKRKRSKRMGARQLQVIQPRGSSVSPLVQRNHNIRGRVSAPDPLRLGHEIDLVDVPANIKPPFEQRSPRMLWRVQAHTNKLYLLYKSEHKRGRDILLEWDRHVRVRTVCTNMQILYSFYSFSDL